MFKSTLVIVLAMFFANTGFAQITWQPLHGPSGANDIKIEAVDSTGRLFLQHGAELFSSTDHGDTWVLSTTGILTDELPILSNMLVLPTGLVLIEAHYKYYQYDPITNSWSKNIQFSSYGDLSLDAQQRLWRVANGNLYYSPDGGQAFNLAISGLQLEGSFNRMANYNDQHNLVSVTYDEQDKLYHFQTNGTRTLVKESSKTQYLGYNLFSGTAFMTNQVHNWRSVDGGLNWAAFTLINPNGPFSAHIKNLYFESATRVLALTDYGMFVSEDDGANWTLLPGLAFESAGHFFRTADGSYFLSRNCSDYDFRRSTDQGETWTDLSSSFYYPWVENIVVARNDVLYARNCSRYERSTDGGQSWSPATEIDGLFLNPDHLVVQPDDDLFSISYYNNHIVHSSDGGMNWADVAQPLDPTTITHYFTIQTDPYGNLYAFYDFIGHSYKSTDKGQSWQPIQFPSYQFTYGLDFLFAPNGDIYDISLSGHVQHYLADQDISILEEIKDVDGEYLQATAAIITAQGDFIFLDYSSLQPQLYRYFSDQPAELINFPGAHPMAMAATPNGLIFVINRDSLYQSGNSGLEWTLVGKMPRDEHPLRFLVGNDQHLYVSYDQHTPYRSTLPLTPRNLITGVVWYDENNNCIRETNETPLVNHYVQAQSGGDYGGFSYTDGQYRIFAPDGTYQVSAAVPNALFEACPSVSVAVNAQNDTAYAEVALRAVAQCPYLRVSASTPLLRRCFPNTYTVRYANEGTAPAAGAYIEITLDSLFDFLSASIPNSQSGQVLTFALGDLPAGVSGQFQVQVEVSCLAALQQEHCFQARILPGTPCLPTLADLSVTKECRTNIGAFDPNDKRAFVAGQEEPGAVLPDQPIEYLIRFQNTGTDTAFTVVVEDRISGVLDLSSVTPLVSSHPFRMELGPERNLRFIFDQILLPDSNINEAASHGFIKFTVRQLPNLPSGTAIHNNAAIYFDFNAAVVTNTSQLVVRIPTGVYEPMLGYSVLAFPNPFHDQLQFIVSGPALFPGGQLLLMDALGSVVREEQFTGSTAQLSRRGLPAGMYFYAVLGERGQWVAAGRVMAD